MRKLEDNPRAPLSHAPNVLLTCELPPDIHQVSRNYGLTAEMLVWMIVEDFHARMPSVIEAGRKKYRARPAENVIPFELPVDGVGDLD